MNSLGYIRAATACPYLLVGDVSHNLNEITKTIEQLSDFDVDLLLTPELSLCGYTCYDLLHQDALIAACESACLKLAESSKHWNIGLVAIGAPLRHYGRLYNTVVLIHKGQILGIVPKSYLPNYKEFYEKRYFTSGLHLANAYHQLGDYSVPIGTDLLFRVANHTQCIVGVEICEDLWVPIPPSSSQSLSGSTIILNASASNEIVGKHRYRRNLIMTQSGRCHAAYLYASSGVHESTTDLVFGGQMMICENGVILQESKRFYRDRSTLIADIDLDLLIHERTENTNFISRLSQSSEQYRFIDFSLNISKNASNHLLRNIDPHPFVPHEAQDLNERCEEIFHIQVSALTKRLEHIGQPSVSIGISGGLDSTLALLVTVKAFDVLRIPRSKIIGITMPGFGTTDRTLRNAKQLMRQLGIADREIDIREHAFEQFKLLNHRPFEIDLDNHDYHTFLDALMTIGDQELHDLVFENVQARIRTCLLMNSGFTIGTGDLSESALGWSTYNADQMSMYNPNIGIPKTLVKFLVIWTAENQFQGECSKVLLDIADTQISPELLPINALGQSTQTTETKVGPYELHDFFLYHMIRYGSRPRKILYLAQQAKFSRDYQPMDIRRWLIVFLKRFFQNQYKRSALPDGPKVGSVSLSPRGDWRMPSDAEVSTWLKDLEDSCD